MALPGIDVDHVARALAEEASRAVERLTYIGLEGLARTASAGVEPARRWIAELGRSVRVQSAGVAPVGLLSSGTPAAPSPQHTGYSSAAGDEPLRSAGPHTLNLPTGEPRQTLAALDFGR